MLSDAPTVAPPPSGAVFTESDIASILREQNLLEPSRERDADPLLQAWCARAAQLLSPQVADRTALENLIALIFSYDAQVLMQGVANQAVLSREGARQVIRELANRILDGSDVESDRFKEIIDGMKEALPYRGRALFFPIRLALAGRTGEGELDRIILLLDAAAKLGFAVPAKGTRQRMLEFCAALD